MYVIERNSGSFIANTVVNNRAGYKCNTLGYRYIYIGGGTDEAPRQQINPGGQKSASASWVKTGDTSLPGWWLFAAAIALLLATGIYACGQRKRSPVSNNEAIGTFLSEIGRLLYFCCLTGPQNLLIF